DVHHQRYESDHHHHGGRQLVDQKADLERRVAAAGPGVDGAVEQVAGHDVGEHVDRQQARGRYTNDGDPVRAGAAAPLADQAGDDRCEETDQRYCQVDRLHQPFNSSRSSTLMDILLRNSTIRIASPIAASAAATVRMKNTNTWPAASSR